MNKPNYRIVFDEFFLGWLVKQSGKSQSQVGKRLAIIKEHAHFGDHKCVDSVNGIYELRWKNGRRIYFVHRANNMILLLLGGKKNGQNRDIKKAKILIQTY